MNLIPVNESFVVLAEFSPNNPLTEAILGKTLQMNIKSFYYLYGRLYEGTIGGILRKWFLRDFLFLALFGLAALLFGPFIKNR